MNENKHRNVGILIFDDAEVLDFCGPFEVFSVASGQSTRPSFQVFTVAEKCPVKARNGLSVNPDFRLDNCPHLEILLVPGGIGTRREMDNKRLIQWIQRSAATAELVLSVCTGALLLGQAGLLDGLEMTTHHMAYDLLRDVVPTGTVSENRRFVDNGNVITSAGIAAGIDMSLHVVERLHGAELAAATARYMEYPWKGTGREIPSKPPQNVQVVGHDAAPNPSSETISSALTAFRTNKGWADNAVAQVSDDKLHVALDPNTNSIAVIMKHVAGNLKSRWTEFLTTDGEKPWRNRDDEFVDTFKSREELLAFWEEGWDCLLDTLSALDERDLARVVPIRGEPHSVPLAIHRSLAHCGYHIGQIIMISRIHAGDNWETITIPRGQSAAYNRSVWGEGHYHT